MADNPISDLEIIWPSIDLWEAGLITPAKNQGECGSCYAFSAIAVLENAILRDFDWYYANKTFWAKNQSTLNLSEQFLISNDFANSYCDGGS